MFGNFDNYNFYGYQFIETKCIDLNFIGKNNEHSILSYKNRDDYKLITIHTVTVSGKKYKALVAIEFFVDDYFWEQYVRKSKSFMETIANICSVNSTIYNILKLVYTFIYSINFDNYKIIQNLLVEKKILNI